MEPTIWSKDNKAWGSARRVQRNYYAYLVTMRMTGGDNRCPTCEGPLILSIAEVDRPTPAYDYRPGNCVYICSGCNQGRSILQSHGRDWTRVADYVLDVMTASASVPIPTVARARAWWENIKPPGSVSRYA